MNVTLWGTRGSVSAAGPATVRYGGETSCVSVVDNSDRLLALDAGSGIRKLGIEAAGRRRIDILLTHLHMDHIQGLGFFGPLFDDGVEVHLWGPAARKGSLFEELTRYLSPPLFPVVLRDLPNVEVHDLFPGRISIGPYRVTADYVIHPGRTVGYRIEADGGTLTYLPDHEPALARDALESSPDWLSGLYLAREADVLIHDAQYTSETYPDHLGWGHSSLQHATEFATAAEVRHLWTFHHDPSHSDDVLHAQEEQARESGRLAFTLSSGLEGTTFAVGS